MSSSFSGGARDPRNAARRVSARRGRRVRAPCLRRSAASIVLLLAGLLTLTASFTAWWTLSIAGSTGLGFYPGDDFGGSIAFGKEKVGAESYQKGGLGAVAGLYETVLGLVLTIATFAIVGGLIGLLAERGKFRRSARGPWVGVLGLLGFLLALAAVITVGAAQATQLHHTAFFGLCGAIGNGSTPCGTFAGSASIAGVSVTWGPGYGFYATIFASIFALAGAIIWWSARKEPWDEEVLPEGVRAPPRYAAARPLSLREVGRSARPGHAVDEGPEAWARRGLRLRRASGAPRRPNGATGPGRPAPRTPRPTAAAAPARDAGAPPPAPEVPPQPPVDLSAASEIEVITQLKERLDAGLLTAEDYARWKGQLLAIPPDAFPVQAGSGDLPQRELHNLDSLRDAGAITGPEYLQLRRRLLLRA